MTRELATDKRHVFVVKQRVALAFLGSKLPDEAVTLGSQALALSTASAVEDGYRELVFDGVRPDDKLDCMLGNYPVFREYERPRKERTSTGAALVARLVPLHVDYREDEHPPVRNRHVALKIPETDDEFAFFETDDEGLLHKDDVPIWVLHPDWREKPTACLAVRKKSFEGKDPQEAECLTPEIERETTDDGEERFFVRVPRPPRVSLPVRVAPRVQREGHPQSRAFLDKHAFWVRVNGDAAVPCGTEVDEQGRILVSFRMERGKHELTVFSLPLGVKAGEKPESELMWFARRVTVKQDDA